MSGRGRGRGAYFKARYGGGGRGAGGFRHEVRATDAQDDIVPATHRSWTALERDMRAIDGQQYGRYNRLRGIYAHETPDFFLSIDHVQGDAYAAPSRVTVRMLYDKTGFPTEYAASEIHAIALADYISRCAADFIGKSHMSDSLNGSDGGWSGPKGGAFNINVPGQEILPRTSAMIIDTTTGSKNVELRFTICLPARGRTILGDQAFKILGINVPNLVKAVLLYSQQDHGKLRTHIETAANQQYMREQLSSRGLVAFVANGAILPRASGASSNPLNSKGVVPFQSPQNLLVTLKRMHGSDVQGMGIQRGVTLLTGGGYHGKSTLLEALELGVYNHIPDDGREMVVTDPTAVKIRAEDGRSVAGTNVEPFIKDLPGRDTTVFTTDDASGSTSMAANIQEALEMGCQTLIIDEDSSATNLLIRDDRMQALIRNEPITPLVSKVQALYKQHGVSTVIVVGSLGDWLSVADRVIGMDSYIPQDLTQAAREIVQTIPRKITLEPIYGILPRRRIYFPQSITQGKCPWAKTKDYITLPNTRTSMPSSTDETINVSGLEQLVEWGQTRLIAHTIPALAALEEEESEFTVQILGVERDMNITNRLPGSLPGGDFVSMRRFELAAAISRLRGLTAVPVNTATIETHKKQRTDNNQHS